MFSPLAESIIYLLIHPPTHPPTHPPIQNNLDPEKFLRAPRSVIDHTLAYIEKKFGTSPSHPPTHPPTSLLPIKSSINAFLPSLIPSSTHPPTHPPTTGSIEGYLDQIGFTADKREKLKAALRE